MPNKDLIEIHMTPPDLLQRMAAYPKDLDREMRKTSEAALLHVQGSVPAYPPQKAGSSYARTGTLGRTLGSSMSGGVAGSPDIKAIKRIGQGKYEARFGTRLFYAPDVIGTGTQKSLFKRLGWWTMRAVQKLAEPGIVKLFNAMAERMVKKIGG